MGLGDGTTSPIPEALAEVLFPHDSTGIFTYALLDAALIPDLPEILETSRLEHVCLFRGERDEIGQAAPWLVRLIKDHKFTRNLFRLSNRTWDLWGRDAGILLRSDAALEDLCAHFRRFTRVRDQAGRWVFFRFWDPLVATYYFPAIAADRDRIARFFCMPTGQTVRVIAQSGPNEMLDMIPVQGCNRSSGRQGPVFDAIDEALFREIGFLAFARQLPKWLIQEYPDQLAARPQSELQAIARHVVAAGRRADLTMKEDFAFLGQMMMTSGGWFLDDDCPPVLARLLSTAPAPKAQALAATYAAVQAETPQGRLFADWPQPQAWLASLPEDEAVTPAIFRAFTARFLGGSEAEIGRAIASTRQRLGELGLDDYQQQGKALVLALLLGPRFFEDPFKEWSRLSPPQAIAAAWQAVTGVPKIA